MPTSDRRLAARKGNIPRGPQGKQGPIGPRGPQGIQGERGPRGATGPPYIDTDSVHKLKRYIAIQGIVSLALVIDFIYRAVT